MASCAVARRCLVAAGCFRSTGGPFRVRRSTAGAWAALHEPLTGCHTTCWCRSRRPLSRGSPAVASMHRLLAAPRGALSAGRAALSATPSRDRGPGPPPEAADESPAHAVQMYPLLFFLDFVVLELTAFPTLLAIGVQLCSVRPQRTSSRFYNRHWFHATSSYYCIYIGNGHLGFFFDGPLLPVRRCRLSAEFGCYRKAELGQIPLPMVGGTPRDADGADEQSCGCILDMIHPMFYIPYDHN